MQSSALIQTLEALVREACANERNLFGYGIWTHHIVAVVHHGRRLAEHLGADPEIVEIAALLHDYAGIKDPRASKEHHIQGAVEAGHLLRRLGYPEDKILAVANCIMSHRGSIELERTSREAVCLASADAMAHIEQVPSLLYLTFVRLGMGIDEGTTWVSEKLERSWRKLCPEAKVLMREQYAAARLLLARNATGYEGQNAGLTMALD